MSTDPIDGQQNAEVVPLRAVDAGTGTHTAESPHAAYTDQSAPGRSASRSSPRTGAPGKRPAST
jgi:hypothetical protein